MAPLHLRADENGTVAVHGPPRVEADVGHGQEAGVGALLGRDQRAEHREHLVVGRTVVGRSIPVTRSVPAVRVPVLSTHTTSTRASTSTAASSWMRAWRRPRRSAPTAKATLVSSTRPSGTMAPMPATELRSASPTDGVLRIWVITSRMPAGTSTQVPTLRMVSVPARSSLLTT